MDTSKQYTQGDLSPSMFNISDGQSVKDGSGVSYIGHVNSNGTRSFSSDPNFGAGAAPTTDYSGMAEKSNSMVNDAFGNYMTAANSMPSSLDTYNKLSTQAGLPELRKTATSLQGTVDNLTDTIRGVDNNVDATTGNSLVTQGQRNSMITSQKQPLLDQLTPLSESLGRTNTAISNSENNVSRMVGYAQNDNQMKLDPLKMGITVAQDNAARLSTGYGQDMQAKLEDYLRRYQSGQQLSTAEQQHMWDLASKEEDYNKQIEVAKAKGTSMIQLGKYGLYDPSTGKIVGASSGGGGGGSTDLFGNSGNEVDLNSFYSQ